MISVTGITDRYILQPTLLDKHKATTEAISASILWKREFASFQKLLERHASHITTTDDKKLLDHFQNIVLYYRGEVLDAIASKLRQHERKLAEMLEFRNESDVTYFTEHGHLMGELTSLNNAIIQYKEELFAFLEKFMQ